jgi:cytochrome c2
VAPALSGKRIYPSLFEFAAAMWNKGPIMKREMQRRAVTVPPLQANELADIVGYLYSMDYFAGPGDPRKGEQIINTKGCLNCHSVRGKGGRIGPDFGKIRGLEQPVNAVSSMWNHASTMEQKTAEKSLVWPILKGQEMGDLVAYLRSLRSKR